MYCGKEGRTPGQYAMIYCGKEGRMQGQYAMMHCSILWEGGKDARSVCHDIL